VPPGFSKPILLRPHTLSTGNLSDL
jgi:hypothetical protein